MKTNLKEDEFCVSTPLRPNSSLAGGRRKLVQMIFRLVDHSCVGIGCSGRDYQSESQFLWVCGKVWLSIPWCLSKGCNSTVRLPRQKQCLWSGRCKDWDAMVHHRAFIMFGSRANLVSENQWEWVTTVPHCCELP